MGAGYPVFIFDFPNVFIVKTRPGKSVAARPPHVVCSIIAIREPQRLGRFDRLRLWWVGARITEHKPRNARQVRGVYVRR